MLRAYKISPIVLCTVVMALVIGELACGTGLYFVLMMAIAMVSIGISYNLLGGLRTFSGLLFIGFAARTIVISQFAKIFFLEAADKNLENPVLTITVYAVFYFSAMVGIFLYCGFRLRLPRPLEPATEADASTLYWVSVILGSLSVVVLQIYVVPFAASVSTYGATTSIAQALGPLLYLALVVAVDRRIRQTDGRHSFGLAAFFPWALVTVSAFINSGRTPMLATSVIYFVTCFFRGYRFRRIHYAAALTMVVLLFAVISPLALYVRGLIAGRNLSDRIYLSFHAIPGLLSGAVTAPVIEQEQGLREQYFSKPGTYLISRFSLIRADSALIDTSSNGNHYGFGPTRLALAYALPFFLAQNKELSENSQDYIGHYVGFSPEGSTNSSPQFSAVGDSYGAFGWLGVVLFPFLVFPAIFVVYESMFDISRPWGTAYFGAAVFLFTEMMVDRTFSLLIRNPLYFVLISYGVGTIVRMIPKRADRAQTEIGDEGLFQTLPSAGTTTAP